MKWLSVLFTGQINIKPYLHGSMVKYLPANSRDKGDVIQSLGQEDSLEKEMAAHSSILAWEIPRTEEPGEL